MKPKINPKKGKDYPVEALSCLFNNKIIHQAHIDFNQRDMFAAHHEGDRKS